MGKRISTKVPRILISGTGSGCGKTTVTCAVLKALVNRGLKTGSFKCGPDYIDTMFHARITGSPCSNLDPFFFDANILRYILSKNGRNNDINIIEGVMGFYDGLGLTNEASTYEVAKKTDSPVCLVVNAKGAAFSVLAVIKGFLDLCEDNHICSVILNNCQPMIYKMLAEKITEQFEGRVRPLGFLPPMPEVALESRHLGLVTAAEVKDLNEKLEILAAKAEETIDLDALTALAESAAELTFEAPEIRRISERVRAETAAAGELEKEMAPVRIAVARDKAFCFYYEDSLDVLRELGAELVDFSPLSDHALPDNIQGLYLGGGYPELYTKELSENTSMLETVRNAVQSGLPCIAECGGFMYLTKAIGEDKMAGVLPGICFNTGKLARFGYITLQAKKDNMLCAAGEEIRGHEFHHWDCTENGEDFTAVKPAGRKWDCVFADDHLYAGFPHFHFLSNLSFAKHFYEAAQGYNKIIKKHPASKKAETGEIICTGRRKDSTFSI